MKKENHIPKARETVQVLIRIEPELKKELEELGRVWQVKTLNKLIIGALNHYLEEFYRKPHKKD